MAVLGIRLKSTKKTDLSSLGEITALMGEATQLLSKVFLDDVDEARRNSARIKEINGACNEVTQALSERLKRSLMTSIDREDIFALATALTGVVDLLDELASAMTQYQAQNYTPQVLLLTDLLQRIVHELEQVVPQVGHPTAIRARLAEINNIQRKSREVCNEALRGLFRDASSLQEALIHKDLYHGLESAMKRCVVASSLVERIAIKNA